MLNDSALDAAVRLAILESFLTGERPTVATIAAATASGTDVVASAFDRLAEGRAIVLAPASREILMAAPFAGTPTDHRVRVGDRAYHANCVWDALGIPAMLAGAARPSDAAIETRCPDCAAALHLRVESGVVFAEPADQVAHFAVPASRWWADIGFT